MYLGSTAQKPIAMGETERKALLSLSPEQNGRLDMFMCVHFLSLVFAFGILIFCSLFQKLVQTQLVNRF